jgi:hypothetical protein
MRVAFRPDSNNGVVKFAEKIEFSSDKVSLFGSDGSLVAISPTSTLVSISLDSRQLTRNEIIAQTTSDILEGNARTYAVTNAYIRRTFATTYGMNVVLFSVGVIAFIAAIVKGSTAHNLTESVPAAIFGGMSAASFTTLFLSKPVSAISRAGLRLSWLVAILNTYWTRLSYFNDMQTIDDDLTRAEADLSRRLTEYSNQMRGYDSDERPTAQAAPEKGEPQ